MPQGLLSVFRRFHMTRSASLGDETRPRQIKSVPLATKVVSISHEPVVRAQPGQFRRSIAFRSLGSIHQRAQFDGIPGRADRQRTV